MTELSMSMFASERDYWKARCLEAETGRDGLREKLMQWGTAMPVLATLLDKALCFDAANRAREMHKEIGAVVRSMVVGGTARSYEAQDE